LLIGLFLLFKSYNQFSHLLPLFLQLVKSLSRSFFSLLFLFLLILNFLNNLMKILFQIRPLLS